LARSCHLRILSGNSPSDNPGTVQDEKIELILTYVPQATLRRVLTACSSYSQGPDRGRLKNNV
ncbi:MAG: hypothetical protein O2782_23005, partial [bacterium]|nr:hypothetical protein [bacterium]